MNPLSTATPSRTGISILAAFGLILFSCSPKLYQPLPEQAQWASNFSNSTVSVMDLSDGKNLYPLYCTPCHDLHMPAEYTIAEWQNIYPKMAENISLSDSSEQKIYLYLLAGEKDAGK